MSEFSVESVTNSLELHRFSGSTRGRFLVADTIGSTLNDVAQELSLPPLGINLITENLAEANARFLAAQGEAVVLADGSSMWMISYNPTYLEQAMIQSVQRVLGRVVLAHVRHTTAHEAYHPYQWMTNPDAFNAEAERSRNSTSPEDYENSWLEVRADAYGYRFGRTRERQWVRSMVNLFDQKKLFGQK